MCVSVMMGVCVSVMMDVCVCDDGCVPVFPCMFQG